MTFVDGTSVKNNEFLNRLEVDVEEGDFIDHWDSGELLFLASSVLRSDRNWASVARSIKPYGEHTRPSDWYTPKNCALQYQKLLNDIEEDTKQKTLPRIERETSEVMLVKNLTEKRLNELERMNQQTKTAASITKAYLEIIEFGEFDDNLDELLKQIEEEEKSEEDKYSEYLTKRESLNVSKRLNKSRVIKSKAKAKVVEPKKRSGFSESADEFLHVREEDEIIKMKKDIIPDDDSCTPVKPSILKTGIDAPITLNALLDSKVTLPSSVPPPSLCLTSLLQSLTSSTSSQSVTSLNSLKEVKTEGPSQQLGQPSCAENSKKIDVFLSPAKIPSTGISPLLASLLKSATVPLSTHGNCMAATLSKESISMDESDSSKGEGEPPLKSRDASPRSSVPQSPCPTPTASPLLNSLLKGQPSSSSQLPTAKEISPKEVSSPQPFFNPTSALATAAAQQLAVATSTNPLSHKFFQHEISESSKSCLQSSPVTSASLSAPTLSKLLEMPPSTPGRLPPLPVLDPPTTPIISTQSATMEQNPLVTKTSPVQMVQVAKKSLPDSPSKELTTNKETAEPPFSTDTSVLQKSIHSYSLADKRAGPSTPSKESSILFPSEKSPGKSKSTPDDVSQENIALLEGVYENINQPFEIKSDKESSMEDKAKITESTEDTAKEERKELKKELILPNISPKQTISVKVEKDIFKEELPIISPKQTSSVEVEKDVFKEDLPIVKIEPQEEVIKNITSSAVTNNSQELSSSSIETESTSIKIGDAPSEEDSKSSKSSDSKSPISKKPRFFEKSSPEKFDSSENEAPTIVRRSGRRGKKGADKNSKNTPKQDDPKDQYEFHESTEENSVGYPASNTLCYMPRVKEDSRSEDSKEKLTFAQESEISNASSASPEKKVITPVRSKAESSNVQSSQVRKALFSSDDEKLSEPLTPSEASDHVLNEDKMMKWEETCEKKDETSLKVTEGSKRTTKVTESSKKKKLPVKRNHAGKSILSAKERKVTSSDIEDVSMESRDLEEVSNQGKNVSEEKVPVPAATVDMEIETNDSHPSSTNEAESDKQLEDIDGGESFQGSITTEFSPPPTNESKEIKETPQFEKQGWFNLVSPKSAEAVLQSSEESEEYESDNWDNHSVSTNKSISHSTGTQSRPKRKETEIIETPKQKKWKKAINIVLRQISCHKNANVFLQKVTNDVAPGYLSIVHRPMDLSLIKKNIDNGVITTTEEFHRDIMLMFLNAIMYNSSDHDVHQMAVEMQRDVVEVITSFLSTQSEKDGASEPVSALRGARKSQKGQGKHPVSRNLKKKSSRVELRQEGRDRRGQDRNKN